MVLDTEFECSVKYQILVIKGKFLAFLAQIWSKIIQYGQKYTMEPRELDKTTFLLSLKN